MPGQKIPFKTKCALKTFGSAMIYFDFERTAETEYQLHPSFQRIEDQSNTEDVRTKPVGTRFTATLCAGVRT